MKSVTCNLKWNTDELKSLDRRTRMFVTMHGAIHSKIGYIDIDRVYLRWKMGGRRLTNCERCIRMEENNLGKYVRNSVWPLIESAKAAETKKYNNTVNKKKFKQSWLRKKNGLWKNKRMYGQLIREIDIRMEESNLGSHVRNSIEPLTESVKAVETTECNNTVSKKKCKQSLLRQKKGLSKNKRMYEQLVREMPETMDEKET